MKSPTPSCSRNWPGATPRRFSAKHMTMTEMELAGEAMVGTHRESSIRLMRGPLKRERRARLHYARQGVRDLNSAERGRSN